MLCEQSADWQPVIAAFNQVVRDFCEGQKKQLTCLKSNMDLVIISIAENGFNANYSISGDTVTFSSPSKWGGDE